MPKTQYYTASSLDGFIADEGQTLEWLLQFGEGDGTSYSEFIREVGALAMGARTYEWVLAHLAKGEMGGAWPYEQPAWVFTHRELPKVEGADIRFVKGDVRAVHRQMAEAAGERNIWLVGGGELVGAFYDEGLLDEIIIQIAPVTLGRGAPLLPREIWRPPLRLMSVQRYGEFCELRYAVPGAA